MNEEAHFETRIKLIRRSLHAGMISWLVGELLFDMKWIQSPLELVQL